jgi:hypothetical protein
MNKVIHFIITNECLQDQLKARRHHPSLEITFRDKGGLHKHKISSGRTDDIHVFRENGVTMVLSRNPRLEYAGLEAFEGDEKINDVFLSGSELLATFGKDDLEPSRMIDVLKEWL